VANASSTPHAPENIAADSWINGAHPPTRGWINLAALAAPVSNPYHGRMPKTFREKITAALHAKKQAQADANESTKALRQQATQENEARIEKAFTLMKTVLEDAVAGLKENGITAELQTCTLQIGRTPATGTGHMLTIGTPPLTAHHVLVFDYPNGQLALNNKKQRWPLPTSLKGAETLVSQIFQALKLT